MVEQFRISDEPPLTARPLLPEDETGVARVFEACDDYFLAATGSAALPADVQSLYYALPEGADFTQKHLLVLCEKETVVGVVDAVAAHPDAPTLSVGLFLLAPAARRAGLGTRAARHLLGQAAAQGMRRVTATCPRDWAPGIAFLTSLGFEERRPRQDSGPTVGNRLRFPAETGLRTFVRDVDGEPVRDRDGTPVGDSDGTPVRDPGGRPVRDPGGRPVRGPGGARSGGGDPDREVS
ncbi:GNAT family N-acetyltransferase [Streptomyces sp. NPDC007084]|uniref:GNAT family N-acetyltransferase n=1 Tax=Streptomyces sp. NPDC007084 TaxID=3154313 RepID=UPI003453BBC7